MEEQKYKFTIGALGEFQEITGKDILFKGADLMNINNAIALIFVGQKAAGKDVSLEEIKSMSPNDFIKEQLEAIKSFGEAFPPEKTTKKKAEKVKKK